MIVTPGQPLECFIVQPVAGQASTAYACEEAAHAHRLALEYAHGKGCAVPPVYRATIRVELGALVEPPVPEGGSPPSLLGDWVDSRPNRKRRRQ